MSSEAPISGNDLAAAQAELVRALTKQGTVPDGFDDARVRLAATSLDNKRARTVARAWPGLARALGPRFTGRFASFVAETPLPPGGSPLTDGYAFARALARSGDLPEEGRLEVMGVDLRCKPSARGLVLRRGGALRACLLKNPPRLVVAVRLPAFGERWLTIPLSVQRQRSEEIR